MMSLFFFLKDDHQCICRLAGTDWENIASKNIDIINLRLMPNLSKNHLQPCWIHLERRGKKMRCESNKCWDCRNEVENWSLMIQTDHQQVKSCNNNIPSLSMFLDASFFASLNNLLLMMLRITFSLILLHTSQHGWAPMKNTKAWN